VATGELAHPVADALAGVIDQLVGAVRAGDGELARPAGGGDDARAQRLANLDRGQPDPAGSAEHQQGLARLQPSTMGQGRMRGAVGHRKAGGGDKIHRIRDRHHGGGRHHDLLGKGIAMGRRHHPLTNPQPLDVAADFGDLAGDFEAWNEGKRRPDLILAGDLQGIGEAEAAGTHANAHLAHANRRARDVVDHQAFRFAPGMAAHGLHAAFLSLGAQARIAAANRAFEPDPRA
jgi:hypothetical protein